MLTFFTNVFTYFNIDSYFFNITRKVVEWIKFVDTSGSPEFENCDTTYRNWLEGILNALNMNIPWTSERIE